MEDRGCASVRQWLHSALWQLVYWLHCAFSLLCLSLLSRLHSDLLYRAMTCYVMRYHVLPSPAFRLHAISWHMLSNALSSPALPCHVLPCPVYSCRILFCPALFCPALPCPALPCPAPFRLPSSNFFSLHQSPAVNRQQLYNIPTSLRRTFFPSQSRTRRITI